MEKKISFVQFQSVKSVAKAIDPYLRQKARLESQLEGLAEEYQQKEEQAIRKLKEKMIADRDAKYKELTSSISDTQGQIDAMEAGIVQIIGFHVTDLVKKVIEPTGKVDKEGKPTKETKYIPTDIVSYDTTTKEFVVNIPDAPVEDPTPIVPPTIEETPGGGFDADIEIQEEVSEEEVAEAEAIEEQPRMPWEQ